MTRSARAPARVAAKPSPAPPTTRDPWAWLAGLAVLPLLFAARGAPLGEPVADDFLFLHPVLFGGLEWLDGGGAPNYWRPIGRQLYYLLMGGTLLERPWLAAALHTTLLAGTGLLLYRALRTRLAGPASAVAAAFPLLMESARMLLAWPADFQDLGALFFGALALERASRGRTVAMLAASLAALLCKEVAAALVVLLPWAPLGAPRRVAERLRVAAAVAALLAVWALAYRAVVRAAGLTAFDPAPGSGATPLAERLAVTVKRAIDSAFGLSPGSRGLEPLVIGGVLLLAVGTAVVLTSNAAARARLRAALPLAGWGAAWFAMAAATLAPLHPVWADYRAVFAAAGLGVVLGALLGAAHPALAGGLAALKLATLLLAPGPTVRIEVAAVERGSLLDFPKHARVQRLMADVHGLLGSLRPPLPRGAAVGQHHLPTMSEYAFAGSAALQAWTRDSTARWLRFDDARKLAPDRLAAMVEYQPLGDRTVTFVAPRALAALDRGLEALRTSRWPEAERDFRAADSLQFDRGARVFIATAGGKRAVCLIELNRLAEAAATADAAYAVRPINADSRYVIAVLEIEAGRPAEAMARLDTLLAYDPGDAGAQALREALRAGRRIVRSGHPAKPGPPPGGHPAKPGPP